MSFLAFMGWWMIPAIPTALFLRYIDEQDWDLSLFLGMLWPVTWAFWLLGAIINYLLEHL